MRTGETHLFVAGLNIVGCASSIAEKKSTIPSGAFPFAAVLPLLVLLEVPLVVVPPFAGLADDEAADGSAGTGGVAVLPVHDQTQVNWIGWDHTCPPTLCGLSGCAVFDPVLLKSGVVEIVL